MDCPCLPTHLEKYSSSRVDLGGMISALNTPKAKMLFLKFCWKSNDHPETWETNVCLGDFRRENCIGHGGSLLPTKRLGPSSLRFWKKGGDPPPEGCLRHQQSIPALCVFFMVYFNMSEKITLCWNIIFNHLRTWCWCGVRGPSLVTPVWPPPPSRETMAFFFAAQRRLEGFNARRTRRIFMVNACFQRSLLTCRLPWYPVWKKDDRTEQHPFSILGRKSMP